MIQINRSIVDTLSKQKNSKQTHGLTDPVLYPLFSLTHTNFTDTLRSLSTYEMARWINYSDRWLRYRINKSNTIGYKRGTILFVDLGSGNFGHEPSFTHPAIVLAQTKESILIVPCSSKKYGKGFPEIIDATPNEGFATNTGIQTNSFRWISKNRVLSVIGTTSSCILDKIDEKLLKLIPSHNKKFFEKEVQLQKSELENNSLKEYIASLENELAKFNNKTNE